MYIITTYEFFSRAFFCQPRLNPPPHYRHHGATTARQPLIFSPGLVPPGEGEDNEWTQIVQIMLKAFTGIGMLGSLVLLLIGIARSETAKPSKNE